MGIDISKAIAAKQQLEAVMSRSGNFASVKFFKLANGKNKIRILPPWSDANVAWREVFQHWGINDSHKAPILCPNKTPGMDHECPICDWVDELKQHTDDPVAMETVNNTRAKRAFLMQIIDYASPVYTVSDMAEWEKTSPDKEAPFSVGDPKIQVYSATISIMDSILGLIGETQTDITELDTGRDLTINRIYNKANPRLTKYEVIPQFNPTKAPVTAEQFEKFKVNLDTVGKVHEFAKLNELLTSGIGAGSTPKLSAGKTAKALPASKMEVPEEDDIPTELPQDENLAKLQAEMQAALSKGKK
jgi:hypothetical protein